MSCRSRKLRHPSMQMTIEPAMKRFQMKRETKKPLCWIWYIFVFTHKRSSPEIHRVFLFPRMIEHLSGLPALMRSKHLAGGSESITRPLFSKSWTPRDRWEGDRGIKYVLIVNRSQMSWSWVPSRQRRPCWGRILTRWRRDRVQAAWHQQEHQHDISSRSSNLVVMRSSGLVVMRSSNLVTWDQATRMFEWIPPSSRSLPSSMQHLYLPSQTIYDRCKFLFKSSNIWRTCLYQYTTGWRHQESSVLYVMWTRGW